MADKLIGAIEQWQQTLQSSLVDSSIESQDKKLEGVLQSIGTSGYPHTNGRSLYDHLTGTRDILRCWSQPFWIQTAGLFHSIYSTDVHSRQVLDMGEREQLQSLIGKRAEQLVYLFHKLPRRSFFDRLSELSSIPTQGLVVPMETSPKLVEFALDPSEVFGLLVVHMANEAEQACFSDGTSGVWLARVSALGVEARKAEGLVPPVFDKCSALFSLSDELLVGEFYYKGFERIPSDLSAADTHFARCSTICPWVAEPLIMRAYLKALEGDTLGASELSLQATKILDQWGTGWDKRLSWTEWKFLAEVLLNQMEPEPFNNLKAEGLKEPRRLFEPQIELSDTGTGGESAATRLERYIHSFTDAGSDPRKRIFPDLPSRPWHEPKEFPIVPELEGAYEQIKEEVMRLPDEDFHRENERIGREGAWDVLFFYERGNKNIGNCARCPTITEIIEQNETLRTQAGLIYLSRLRPGTHIAPHRGPTNIRVRCHLGIQVPDGECAIRVGNEVGAWRQGRCVVFDDFYEHEAWNRTTEDRIVLIVDLWHPALTQYEREVLKGLHLYAFAHAQNIHHYWIQNMRSKFTIGVSRDNTQSTMHEYH
jgi:hypothetical protein